MVKWCFLTSHELHTMSFGKQRPSLWSFDTSQAWTTRISAEQSRAQWNSFEYRLKLLRKACRFFHQIIAGLEKAALFFPPLPDLRYNSSILVTCKLQLIKQWMQLIMNIYELYRFFSPILAWTEGRQRQEKHKIKTGQDNTVQLQYSVPDHNIPQCTALQMAR